MLYSHVINILEPALRIENLRHMFPKDHIGLYMDNSMAILRKVILLVKMLHIQWSIPINA